MPKQHQAIRFMQERSVEDSNTAQRLYYPAVHEKVKTSYEEIAEIIRRDPIVVDYFLDTNVFTSHEIQACFWDALGEKRVTLTEGVWRELGPWRANPKCNGHLVSRLEAARGRKSEKILFDDEAGWGNPCGTFRNWYANLLLERKRRAVFLVEQFEKDNGRSPTESEKNNLFQKGFNERDIKIFQKGVREVQKTGNPHTDEELVATAAMVSLAAGRSVTIFTRDHDVFEHFFKLTELLTVHYQATLFAARFAADPSAYKQTAMPATPETEEYFDVPDSFLVRKPVPPEEFLLWLLPKEYTRLRFTCVLMTGSADDLWMTPLMYFGEVEMLCLVEAKGKSNGLHTHLVDGRNCHVTGFPKGIPNPREHVVIARDLLVMEERTGLKFPRLDLAHAVYHNSQLRHSESVKPGAS
jgi:hypothetical protein